MNKYYLFGGEDYYPKGGIEDIIGVFSAVKDAKNMAQKYLFENKSENKVLRGNCYVELCWAQIVDFDDLENAMYAVDIDNLEQNDKIKWITKEQYDKRYD